MFNQTYVTKHNFCITTDQFLNTQDLLMQQQLLLSQVFHSPITLTRSLSLTNNPNSRFSRLSVLLFLVKTAANLITFRSHSLYSRAFTSSFHIIRSHIIISRSRSQSSCFIKLNIREHTLTLYFPYLVKWHPIESCIPIRLIAKLWIIVTSSSTAEDPIGHVLFFFCDCGSIN